MIVLFSALLFSKSSCLLELCYIYLHLLRASTEGVQRNVATKYQSTLRNIPEELGSNLYCGESQKLRKGSKDKEISGL
jgi:hypothetical protein